jgi:hypothetical protein
MNRTSHWILAAAVGAAVLLPATAAQPQYYGAPSPAPLYPYAAPRGQSYAVEVAPNTYVIQRPGQGRSQPYVGAERKGNIITRVETRAEPKPVEPKPGRFDRQPKPNDPAVIEELRQRHSKRVINTKKIVYEKPVVIETKRYVDDPPRVIERHHYVDGDAPTAAPAPARRGKRVATATIEPQEFKERPAKKRAGHDDNKKRVIEADAEVTILGPDRMSIRLFRKGQRGANASASVE